MSTISRTDSTIPTYTANQTTQSTQANSTKNQEPEQENNGTNPEDSVELSKDAEDEIQFDRKGEKKTFDKVISELKKEGVEISPEMEEEIAGRIDSLSDGVLNQRGSGFAKQMAHDIQDWTKSEADSLENYKKDTKLGDLKCNFAQSVLQQPAA